MTGDPMTGDAIPTGRSRAIPMAGEFVAIPRAPQVKPASQRLTSLDALRGLTVASMILVNNNGDPRHAYWELLHSRWNGWTPTDIIFPAFLFMVGLSMSFSLRSRVEAGTPPIKLMPGILRRTVILILLGLVVNGYPFFHLSSLRFYGVLQRIALCFFFTSLLVLWTNTHARVAAFLALLIGYWLLMRYVPVPGYGVPLRDFGLLDPWKNLAAFFDRAIFPRHLYGDGTYDPEGGLSTLPAIATTLVGVLAGEWLRTARAPRLKAKALLAAGTLSLIAAQWWSVSFPFNKRLWTSSYVLLAAGITLILLALLYWMIDVQRLTGGWTLPWIVFGTNAITAYVFSELLAPTLQLIHLPGGANLQQASMTYIFLKIPDPALASLAYSVTFVVVCFLPVLWMYRRKVFLRV